MGSTLDGNLHVAGHLTSQSASLPAGTLTNAMVNGSAGIAATKIQKPRVLAYNQSGTATSVTVALYECRGATATIQNIRAGSIVANIGVSTVTVDLKKNGVSILTGVITLDNANTARVAEAGTLSGASMVLGDWLEIVTVATLGGGTLATGLFVQCEVFEDQP